MDGSGTNLGIVKIANVFGRETDDAHCQKSLSRIRSRASGIARFAVTNAVANVRHINDTWPNDASNGASKENDSSLKTSIRTDTFPPGTVRTVEENMTETTASGVEREIG